MKKIVLTVFMVVGFISFSGAHEAPAPVQDCWKEAEVAADAVYKFGEAIGQIPTYDQLHDVFADVFERCVNRTGNGSVVTITVEK